MNAETDREGHNESEIEAESAVETATDIEVDVDADIDALDEGEWVDARHPPHNMVSTPSVSGDEEAAAKVLEVPFEVYDRGVWIDEVDNICAPADGVVLLISHVDTIPSDVPAKVEDGVLWSRGSVDATGPPCTTVATAVETGVSSVGVVGEETSSRGAWHLAENREEPDVVVSGEPSGQDGITLGYRRFPSGTYTSASELGHPSRPEGNAIQSAVAWWFRVADFFDEDRDGIFDTVTIKPVTFDDGPTEDSLAVEATVDVQFRVSPRPSIGDVREVAESELTRGGVRWSKPIPSVMMSPHTNVMWAFRVAIRNVGDVKPRLLCKTGTSDINTSAGTWDYLMAAYGPGNPDLGHTPNEHLDLAKSDSTINMLVNVCERLADD